MLSAQWIREVVLPAYPKVFTSPEREITGLSSIIERRKEITREIDNALRQKRHQQRHQYPHPRKQKPR